MRKGCKCFNHPIKNYGSNVRKNSQIKKLFRKIDKIIFVVYPHKSHFF